MMAVQRRNLTAGQKAIAAAEAWEMLDGKKLPKRREEVLADLFHTNRLYVQHARALVERDPLGAQAVKDGARQSSSQGRRAPVARQ